jgi:hypothetical protein
MTIQKTVTSGFSGALQSLQAAHGNTAATETAAPMTANGLSLSIMTFLRGKKGQKTKKGKKI